MEYIFTLLLYAGLLSFFVIFLNFIFLWYHKTIGHYKVKTMLAADIDPVCGLKLEEKQGYSKYHGGYIFRFCSKECVDKFDVNPDKYIGKYNINSLSKKERTSGL